MSKLDLNQYRIIFQLQSQFQWIWKRFWDNGCCKLYKERSNSIYIKAKNMTKQKEMGQYEFSIKFLKILSWEIMKGITDTGLGISTKGNKKTKEYSSFQTLLELLETLRL